MQTKYNSSLPLVFAICGWSGSGKTWLLERLVEHFSKQGLAVGVVKHDAHQLELDHDGKDTDRLWQAGACQLLAHDQQQIFIRARKTTFENIETHLNYLSRHVDFVLLEGHKNTTLPKLWLEHPEKRDKPDGLQNIQAILPWDAADRLEFAVDIINNWLTVAWSAIPLGAGILVGGKSKRMGQPKAALNWQGKNLIESILDTVKLIIPNPLLLGQLPEGISFPDIKQIPDITGCAGPMTGMLSAMRWEPNRGWLFAACDMPLISVEALQWLQTQRQPGRWVVLPCIEDKAQPLLAIYEPQAKEILENAYRTGNFALRKTLHHPKTYRVAIPEKLTANWVNCNTPEEWSALQNHLKI